jgi:iron(III) transport system substrate-binding protein
MALYPLSSPWCAQAQTVTVYTALDQVYSEPILKQFEKDTGIEVRAVYDIEATKTIGLVNRLIAEKGYPQCDVFWNNEPVNTIRLKNKEVLAPSFPKNVQSIPSLYKDPDHYWYGFAARTRVLVYNPELIPEDRVPTSIHDFTKPEWKGKACIAVPLFGTTATQMTALFQKWGSEQTLAFLDQLKKNHIAFVDGNSVVRDKVAQGTYAWGITDTDDAYSGIERGMALKMVFPDKHGMGTLVIPNTVSKIAGAPHPDEANALIEYLLRPETEELLARSGSAQIPLRPGLAPVAAIPALDTITQMDVDINRLAKVMETALPAIENALDQ